MCVVFSLRSFDVRRSRSVEFFKLQIGTGQDLELLQQFVLFVEILCF